METIYTIPIHDAYQVRSGCPVCRLEHDLETASLEYVLGAAMMEPDVRIEINRYGFCSKHFSAMLKMQKRLPLALILESYTQEMLVQITQQAPGKREFPVITEKFSIAADGCFVCKQLTDRLMKYYSNIVHLWLHEVEFREETRNQPYFCPHHLAGLLTCAQKELPKKYFTDFYTDHTSKTAEKLSALSEKISKFCKSFDYRFTDELGEARTAVEDAIAFLTGADTEC